ncbi:hypothetical protein [Selenihalanaerobacter shriftii]|uniref:Com family DNA-binding transcriptional regulator n=1 Tax=Selenihalanaerobacter shriftii TaxID=142842 RepID=A0A1T4LW14_9FIRM|nr:hypothetical protein [Selenihalanaerobacter shriftii]SJZ58644.1 hypothetical protein SAMN02745118_01263 [Selenihalanaerobacter shriftii]
MDDLRCKCDKLVAKVEGDSVIIKCRHCKRFLIIQTRDIKSIEYTDNLKTRVQRL